jgi:tRNA dimethylallyltransferase
MGYSPDLPSMSGIGYRQIYEYIRGSLTLEEAVQQIKFQTHRYIRQQYAWFRLKDERIHWFNIYTDGAEREIMAEVASFVRSY